MRLRQLRVVCAFASNCNYLRHDDGKQQQHANMPSSYQIFESNAKNYFHLKHSLPHFILFTSLAVWSPDCLFVCTLACWFLHLVVVLCASLLFWFLCVFFFVALFRSFNVATSCAIRRSWPHAIDWFAFLPLSQRLFVVLFVGCCCVCCSSCMRTQ